MSCFEMSSKQPTIKGGAEGEIPVWFLAGDRQLNVWHAQLRMKCSSLNDDLHSYIHVTDTPTCACGFRRETSKHFLLDCPLFQVERQDMLSDLSDLGFKALISNLLFGNSEYSTETNLKAFNIIQNFFKN